MATRSHFSTFTLVVQYPVHAKVKKVETVLQEVVNRSKCESSRIKVQITKYTNLTRVNGSYFTNNGLVSCYTDLKVSSPRPN